MVAEIPLVPVNLATVALESCLYGAFMVLAITSISLLRARNVKLSSPIFLGVVAMTSTITAHWILTVDRSFLAFLYFENGTSPLGFYGDLSQITEVVKTGFLMATLTIGDALIIHRLWIIWNRKFAVLIFPLSTLLGLTVCGVGITYQFTQYKPGQNVFLSEAGRWITSDAVFTLSTNIYSTGFITWRILKSSRAIKPFVGDTSNLMSVLGIIVESAALYTTWSLFFFVTYQSGSNLQFNAVDCWPVMSGISCMLIHVRVGLGWAHKAESTGNLKSTGVVSSGIQRPGVAVNISRAVHATRDYDLPLDELDGSQSKLGLRQSKLSV
ncbi:hypothetical protein MIND_00894800 [Mycena indigotica]|uniref:Uncharacterized protein n=1 Tax=Mycena indigotica TaxID=2126181 RepID=A0A8H6SHI0_9AGAR|nr:uncharacterized protein MIND_00894800 [Mycena indigotica]KAF7299449.1 hypothetical protein MIND_00894800 [Mycena indigotica]